MHLTFNNYSDDDILTYGLQGYLNASPFDLSRFCELKGSGTGIAFALYYPDGTQNRPTIKIIDSFGQRRITKEILDSALHANNVNFIKSAAVLKKHEYVSFTRQIPLNNFQMEKGQYYMQVIYYSGDKTLELLDIDAIKNSKSKLFHGCVLSRKIPFIVN